MFFVGVASVNKPKWLWLLASIAIAATGRSILYETVQNAFTLYRIGENRSLSTKYSIITARLL